MLCYGPTRHFKPPMLSRCTNLGIARAAPPCNSGSANDRQRTPVIAMLRQGIGTSRKNLNACIEIFSRCFDAKYHRRYIAEQRRAVGEHSAMYTKAKNVPLTSAPHRRCSCKHRRCIFDVIISPMVWWSIADPSPMFPSCSAKHRRYYGDASLSVINLPSDWSPMITWALL